MLLLVRNQQCRGTEGTLFMHQLLHCIALYFWAPCAPRWRGGSHGAHPKQKAHFIVSVPVYDTVLLFSALTLLAAGRASGLQKLSGGVLAWLSVRSQVQTCIWPS